MPVQACRNASDAHLQPALHTGGTDTSSPLDVGAIWIEKPKRNGKKIARRRDEKSRLCPGVPWSTSPYAGTVSIWHVTEDCGKGTCVQVKGSLCEDKWSYVALP